MKSTFLTEIYIIKVRHLTNIRIPLSSVSRKNLIFTGKNGSGKTSVLNAIKAHLDFVNTDSYVLTKQSDEQAGQNNYPNDESCGADKAFSSLEDRQILPPCQTDGVVVNFASFTEFRKKYLSGQFIFAYYGDTRNMDVAISPSIEKIDFKPFYTINDSPCRDLVKYLVDLKATQAFSKSESRKQEIASWFDRFQNILRMIYDDNSLVLEFNEDTFQFFIKVDGREPFDFNTMSMGYAAVFNIIGDLIMRMETKVKRDYDLEGIVLIDEIETHLHPKLQKQIMSILTGLFPNLQFILTTHSPFVLNSAQNAVIYDLENHILVENGLTNLPYEGIVEGYFGADRLSDELRKRFERYRELAQKSELSDAEHAEIAELELYLDEIPDYLAIEYTTEYSRLKAELHNGRKSDGKG